jgi:hypothetical protein
MKHINRFIAIILFLIVFCSLSPHPIQAKELSIFGHARNVQPLNRTINSVMTLNDLELPQNTSDYSLLSKGSLSKEYFRLLNIARAFGTDFTINIPIQGKSNNQYYIVGIKNKKGEWSNMTVGRAIDFVSYMLAIKDLVLEPNSKLYLNMLIKNLKSNIYYELEPIDIFQYCHLLISR